MMKRLFVILSLLLSASLVTAETPDQKAVRMQWFEDARLGIFIHWGIYAVNGIDESWSFYNEYITHEDYMKQLAGFTASAYEPKAWADLVKESGAQYAVLTTKHHDGVALWDSEHSDLNVVKKTPAGMDLIKPFVKALRKRNIRAGLYFSQLDWSHVDYPHFTRTEKRYDPVADTLRWQRFLFFQQSQLQEIMGLYKPDLIWFDGDWDYDAAMWRAAQQRDMIFEKLPNVIINSRLKGYGDYATPEQGVPIHRPEERWWELCMTINDSWGYQGNDHNYKTPNQIIRLFTECLSKGGNLLLDIGPKADGAIPDEQVNILKELGRWTRKHREAIYETRAGIPADYFYGPTALSADSTILYLYLEHKPNGPLLIKGLINPIQRIWVVGNGAKLNWDVKMKQYWSAIPGLVYIDVPEEVLDEQVTVLAVLLDGPVQLWERTKSG